MKKYSNVAFILRPLYIVSKRLYYIQIEGSIYYYNYIIYIINIYNIYKYIPKCILFLFCPPSGEQLYLKYLKIFNIIYLKIFI